MHGFKNIKNSRSSQPNQTNIYGVYGLVVKCQRVAFGREIGLTFNADDAMANCHEEYTNSKFNDFLVDGYDRDTMNQTINI